MDGCGALGGGSDRDATSAGAVAIVGGENVAPKLHFAQVDKARLQSPQDAIVLVSVEDLGAPSASIERVKRRRRGRARRAQACRIEGP